jgi:N-acetylmuramoyl-L-alanine amidase
MNPMRVNLSRWSLGAAFGLFVAITPVRASELKALSIQAVAADTRIEWALNADRIAQVFRLSDPERLVVDLNDVSASTALAKSIVPTGVVRAVRMAKHADGVLRVVFDLTGPVQMEGHTVVANGAPLRLNAVARDGDHRWMLTLRADAARVASAPVSVPAAASSLTAPVSPPAAVSSPVTASVERTVSRASADRGRAFRNVATRNLVIAVDAGHGGEDPGASGRDGTHEKDVTLAIARVLAARIESEPGMHAVLTRTNDVFVPLRERSQRARQAQADLFVSIHADAVLDRSVAGASVYVLSAHGASSEAAKWLAERENAADLVGGVSLEGKDRVLASVLLDLSQSAAMSASMAAAEKVVEQLNSVGEVRKSQVQKAGFMVLKSPDIPSMLIETAYITNPDEERRLRDAAYQEKLADAIVVGLKSYFRESAPPGTRLAQVSAVSVNTP